MTRDSLILFIKRILDCGSEVKAAAVLRQLEGILEMQNADAEMLRLVSQTRLSVPEAKTEAKKERFTEDDLQIAIRRAEDRRRREAALAAIGRC